MSAAEERSKILSPSPPTYDDLSSQATSLLSGLLCKDHERRFGGREARREAFFGGMSWQKVLSKAYAAPVKPTIAHELDLSNFDQEFTDAALVESSGGQRNEHFAGFTYRHDEGGKGFAAITQALRTDRRGGGGGGGGARRPRPPRKGGGGNRGANS